MKWLRLFFLMAVVAAVGCSSAPSGDANHPAPATDEVDESVERGLTAGP